MSRWVTPHHSLLFVLLVLSVSWPVAPVWGEVEYIPIPAVSSSKNDGSDAGLILPILMTSSEGELEYIIAPMFIVNSIVGARGTLNVFHYQPGGRSWRFIGSYTEEIERRISFDYSDPAFGQGQFALRLGGHFFKNATARFYGFGQTAQVSDETNFTDQEIRANWQFGLHFNEVTQVALGQRFRKVQLERGGTDLPFTLDQFPGVDGGGGATILGHRATFLYDSRDNLVSPTDGAQVTAYAELNQNLDNEAHPLFYRYRVEVKKLLPSESKRVIVVLRGDFQATFGDEVPFYERSSLGGPGNLRGYGADRFIDKQLVSFNIEYRFHVLRAHVFGVDADFELAPFVDTGRVFNTFKDIQLLTNVEVTPGIGFRGIVRPNVVGRVDYGYSEEGGAVFAGLDFPF